MSVSPVKLGGVVAEYVAAVNAFDEDAIVATFADDAFVNDARREFWGKDAIRRWVREDWRFRPGRCHRRPSRA